MRAKTMEEIAQQLNDIRFRRRLLGGVNEDVVWRVLEKLQKEYREVVESQRIAYEALLDDRNRTIYRLNSQFTDPWDGGANNA